MKLAARLVTVALVLAPFTAFADTFDFTCPPFCGPPPPSTLNAPVITSPASVVLTNGTTYTIEGTSDENTTVTVYDSGNNVAGQQSLGAGETNFSILVSLVSDSENIFTAKADDGSTISDPTTVATITQDGTAPSASLGLSTATHLKTGGSITITATFSEAVQDGTPSISIGGANTLATTTMTKVDSTHYTYDYVASAGNGSAQVLVFDAQDAATNRAATSSTIFVIDSTAPVITISGDSNVTLTVGDSYSDAGASVSDNLDEGLSVSTSGVVDTSSTGTYTVHYNASDTAGNAASEVTRTVTVNEKPSSGGGGGGGGGGNGPIVGLIAPPVNAPAPAPSTPPVSMPPAETPPVATEPTVTVASNSIENTTNVDTHATDVPDATVAPEITPPKATPDVTSPENLQAAAAATSSAGIPTWLWIIILMLLALGALWYAWDQYEKYKQRSEINQQ